MDVLLLLILIIILIIIIISIVSVIQIYRLPIQMKGKNFLTDLLGKSQKDLTEKFESKDCQEKNPWGELKIYNGKYTTLLVFGDHRWIILLDKIRFDGDEGIEFNNGQYKYYESEYDKKIYLPIINFYYWFQDILDSNDSSNSLFVPNMMKKPENPNDPREYTINYRISNENNTSKDVYNQIMEDYEKQFLPILKEKFGETFMNNHLTYGDLFKKPFISDKYFKSFFSSGGFYNFPVITNNDQ